VGNGRGRSQKESKRGEDRQTKITPYVARAGSLLRFNREDQKEGASAEEDGKGTDGGQE